MATPQLNKGLGWKPSLPDARDWKHDFRFAAVATSVDLRETGNLPDVWDQGQLGSCVAHGVLGALGYDLAKQGGDKNFSASRLFVYYNGRVMENTVSEDSGLTVTDGIKAINKQGAPPETDWPYTISKFTQKPPQKAFDDGLLRQTVQYAQVAQTVNDMQACLTAGFPIVVGFTVYSSFESDAVAETGDVPMPGRSEQVLGGHCVLIVGYTVRNGKPVWICRNSWGTGWGDKGYFYMPQSYFLNTDLSDDFWIVQKVEVPTPPIPPQPPIPPTPPVVVGPTVDTVDSVLWNKIGVWANTGHTNTAGNKAAATAARNWAVAYGFKTPVVAKGWKATLKKLIGK